MPVLGTMGRLRDNKELSNDYDSYTFLPFIVYSFPLFLLDYIFLPACGISLLTISSLLPSVVNTRA